MTTTSSLLFSKSLAELFVVAEVEDARGLAAQTGSLLLGERGGEKVGGFDGGNSPLEYTQSLRGQKAVLCTSNGSKAVETTSDIEHVFLGAIVSARAVAERVLEVAQENITLICAGTNGETSFDDVLGAGSLVKELLELDSTLDITYACQAALGNLEQIPDILSGLLGAHHAAVLQNLGYEDDIDFAATLNLLDDVPMRTSRNPARFTRVP